MNVLLPAMGSAVQFLKFRQSEYVDKIWVTDTELHTLPAINTSIVVGVEQDVFVCPIPPGNQLGGFYLLPGWSLTLNCSFGPRSTAQILLHRQPHT